MDSVFNDTVNIIEIDEGFDHYTLVTLVLLVTTQVRSLCNLSPA